MKAVTPGQKLEVALTIVNRVNWDQIDGDELQENVVKKPEELGQQATLFLKHGGRVLIGEPKVIKLGTEPFNPVHFLGQGWETVERDEREDKLKEVDLNVVLLKVCLKEGESSITGEEKLKRLKLEPHTRLGGRTFLALWLDYQVNKENSVLEWLFRNRKIAYLDFFGLVLRRSSGDRRVLYLERFGGGEWDWCYGWLDDDWSAGRGSASLASENLVPQT